MTLHPIGSYPICAVDGAGTPSPFYAATIAKTGQTYLVVIQPYKIGATRAPAIRAVPIGTQPICVISNNSGQAGLVSLFYSDNGYTSPGNGNNANIHFDGRVTQALRMTWGLPVVPEASRRVVLDTSALELLNADGDLDSIINSYDIGGRAITVLFGLKNYAYDQFTPIWSGRGKDWSRDFTKVSIEARDAGYQFEVPLQTAFYGGAGGADGPSTLANKPKPLCYGKVRNITPLAIDTTNLVYQFHSGAVAGVDAVYDKGVALSATSNYASYAALVAATPGTGNYATCTAAGLIKLGAVPAGNVTMDARGDASGSGYVSTTSTIIQRLLTAVGGISSGALDSWAFSAFDTAVPGTIGWYLSGDQVITIAEAMEQLVGHCDGYWGALPNGIFTIGRVDAPAEANVTEEFDALDIIDVEVIAAPEGSMPPRFRQRVSYQKNWTVQQPTDLASSVTQARALTLYQPNLVASSLNSNTQADFLLAQDPPVLDTLFDGASDATTLADRLMGKLGVMRQTLRVRADSKGLRIPRGACIGLTTSRINGGSRWLARYIGADTDATNHEHDLILWG